MQAGVTVAALGVVFGDIGTSPLYVLKTCLETAHVTPTVPSLLGVLSLIIWALIIVVCIKYITIIMRVTHDGEGGILALLALLLPQSERGAPPRAMWFVLVAVVGAAMLFGDGVITPAISVISAVEGIGVVTTAALPLIVPISLGIVIALFAIQRSGTERVGAFFGPIMALWFLAIGVAGVVAIVGAPEILYALDPRNAIGFATSHGVFGFLVLGGVILCITGVEALYADLSHFGRVPITIGWYALVFPALALNYLGQGAKLIVDPSAISNPFFALSGGWTLIPMVVLATLATVIASQALISGAFTLTEQAIALNLSPRVEVTHTSNRYPGQVFVATINWLLFIACATLIVTFKSSDRLAAAYGLAVAVTMMATSITFYLVVSRKLGWSPLASIGTATFFLLVDGSFVAASLPKFLEGGYVPVLIAALLTTIALTWLEGRRCVAKSLANEQEPIESFLAETAGDTRVLDGTMVFLTGDNTGVPFISNHRWLRRRAKHERIVLLTLARMPGPYVDNAERVSIDRVSDKLVRVVARFGFMERPRIAPVLGACASFGLLLDDPETSFFYADPKIVPMKGGMWKAQRWLFTVLLHNSRPMPDELRIPADRRVELGLEVAI